jgi:hypothetical protein
MAATDVTSGVLFGLLALGLALGCSGASFESGGTGGSGGTASAGGTSGTSGKGGASGKGGGSKGGSGGSAGTNGGAGGSSGSGTRGGMGGGGGTSASGGSSGTGADGGTAGTSASGGTSGAGGTASGGTSGTAGSSACVAGDPCVTPGDTCVEDVCCPCLLGCEGGAWAPKACPDCAVSSCPPDPPANGTACTACELPSDGCQWDECPQDGPLYTGACVEDRWEITADPSCGLGGACCTGNGDCPDHHCVSDVCKSDDARGCWDDDQCDNEEVCSGVWVCPCNADCGGFDEPGTCVPKDLGCCIDDGDCKASETCLRGVCKLPAPDGGCWSDRDCPGGSCESEAVCACNESCLVPDHAGTCLDVVPLPF